MPITIFPVVLMSSSATTSSLFCRLEADVQSLREEHAQLRRANLEKDKTIAELRLQLQRAQRALALRNEGAMKLRQALSETREAASDNWASFVIASNFIEEAKLADGNPLVDLIICGICQRYKDTNHPDFEAVYYSCEIEGCMDPAVPVCSTCIAEEKQKHYEISCAMCLGF